MGSCFLHSSGRDVSVFCQFDARGRSCGFDEAFFEVLDHGSLQSLEDAEDELGLT